jgi:hypothetical protein
LPHPSLLGDLTLQNSWPKLHDPEELPKPELNPLLNPLLERNLGRWAQVYFTHPPEARERAVLDLLRELDSETSPGKRPQSSAAQAAATPRTADSVFCSACDRENLPQQRFCGFCGSPLRSREMVFPPRAQFTNPSEEPLEEPETLSFLGLSSFDRPSSTRPSLAPPPLDRPSPGNESDLQFLRTKDFGSEYRSDPGPLRRLLFAGMVVLLIAGAYMGWPYLRAHLPSSVPTSIAAPSSPAANVPPQTAATPSTEPIQTPPSSAQAQSQQPSEPVPPPTPPPQSKQAAHEIADPTFRVAPGAVPASLASRTRSAAISSNSAGKPGVGDGTQELILAQHYLDGKGAPRDTASAARWLWKAVSKQNPRAALQLADLYTRGDGVSKSCAQARILLGVAADKGVREAAQKLHDLEASGCR